MRKRHMTFHDYVTGNGGQIIPTSQEASNMGMLEGSGAHEGSGGHSDNATRKAGRDQQCTGR